MTKSWLLDLRYNPGDSPRNKHTTILSPWLKRLRFPFLPLSPMQETHVLVVFPPSSKINLPLVTRGSPLQFSRDMELKALRIKSDNAENGALAVRVEPGRKSMPSAEVAASVWIKWDENV